jgi:hypothetical protein
VETSAPAAPEAGGDVAVATASTKKNTIPVAKGVPKSGRVWKSTNNKRYLHSTQILQLSSIC